MLFFLKLLFILGIFASSSLSSAGINNGGQVEVCTCNPTAIEILNRTIDRILDILKRIPPNLYVDYCSVGIKDGRVNENDFAASSIKDHSSPAHAGRLDYQGQNNPRTAAGWAAQTNTSGVWIQVDLRNQTYISAVITQGRGDADHWITSFKIAYAQDMSTFKTIKDLNGNDVVFPGNKDRNTYVMNRFPQPITARYFRLIAFTWHNHIAGRLEYVNC